jgi:hypothetical protein
LLVGQTGETLVPGSKQQQQGADLAHIYSRTNNAYVGALDDAMEGVGLVGRGLTCAGGIATPTIETGSYVPTFLVHAPAPAPRQAQLQAPRAL